jgi:TRAP-type C4-dicarboxylate transport system substrate-binding protein
MKLILWTPATSPSYSLAWEPFMQKLEEVTNNRIKLTVYPGGSLAKSDQQYDFIATGSADMGPLLTAFEPGQFPISDTLSLPFLGINSAKQGGTVHWNLYEKYQAAMDSHYKGVKILCAFMSGPAVFYSAKKPVRTVEDFKGMKLRAAGDGQVAAVKAIGAVPVNVFSNEQYDALEKGIMDGGFMDWNGMSTHRVKDIAKYYTQLNFGGTVWSFAMNLDKWNSLPKDIQDSLFAMCGLAGSEWLGENIFQDEPRKADALAVPGTEYIVPGPEFEVKLRDMTKSVHDKYISDLNDKGLPGQEIYDYILDQIAKSK